MMNASIEHNFNYHPPHGDAGGIHAAIRLKAKELAHLIEDTLPDTAGRERAIAITKAEEAMMWACAGITRHFQSTKSSSTGFPVAEALLEQHPTAEFRDNE